MKVEPNTQENLYKFQELTVAWNKPQCIFYLKNKYEIASSIASKLISHQISA